MRAMRWGVISASLAIGAAACAAETQLTKEGLAKDLALLKKAYAALHPGLLRYNSPAQLDANYAELDRAWNRNQTLSAAFWSLSEFLAKIKCGHTYANFFNQEDEVAAELFTAPTVPFRFRWIGDKMVSTRDRSIEGAFPVGSEISAIDGIPTGTILRKLMRVARADGSNDAKRVALLEATGAERLESFDIYFSLAFPTKRRDRSFLVRTPAEFRPTELRAVSVDPKVFLDSNAGANTYAPAFSLTFPAPHTALLRMPTWAMYNLKWDWQGFLSATMDRLASESTPNLIIDLRGNEGGNSCGDLILERLIDKPAQGEAFLRYTRYQRVPSDLQKFLSTWDRSFYDWGDKATMAPNGFYRMSAFDDPEPGAVRPKGAPYRGKVFVLIGPENSSATFEFALQMKRLKLGTLIGRPTGGSQRGINGGAFFFLTLPNSKIEVDVPLIAQFFDSDRPDAGVTPDVLILPTARAIAEGRDLELEAALRLASKP